MCISVRTTFALYACVSLDSLKPADPAGFSWLFFYNFAFYSMFFLPEYFSDDKAYDKSSDMGPECDTAYISCSSGQGSCAGDYLQNKPVSQHEICTDINNRDKSEDGN